MEFLKCKRCEHTWIKRQVRNPSCCPKCHSPLWDKDRVRKPKGGK